MSPDPSAAAADDHGAEIRSLVDRLRQRAADRRDAGEYPADLAAQLDGHFERIASHHTPEYDFAELRRRHERLGSVSTFSQDRIEFSTRIPGGSILHRLIAKVVGRQISGVFAQLQDHANALSSYTQELTHALEHPKFHEHKEVTSQLDLLFERIASFQRATAGAPAVGALMDRVAALEDEQDRRRFHPWFSNEEFEAAFRGNPDEIRRRYRDLALTFLEADGRVVDLGCGRGEFIELMLELGIDALGIEIDPSLVAMTQDRDLPVEFGSITPWLEGQADQSLGGLSLIQVVEHISAQELVEFVTLAHRKVKTGAKVVVETVNPQSLYVFAHSFYLDPTHVAPVHPAYLMFLFQQAGFTKVDIDWRSPCPPDDVLEAPTGSNELETLLARNVERLNRLLLSAQDYALIATR